MPPCKYLNRLLPLLALLLAGCASTEAPHSLSYDGLELVPGTRFAQVYRRPGAALTGYEGYGLVPCQVAFRQNWLRDQNSSALNLSSRVTQKDVDQIKDRLGEACDQYFREALERAPPYPLVSSFSDGERVLILRPAIINLDISAPDTLSAGRGRTFTTEAGQMTLVLEVIDATTGEILVRVVDQQRDTRTNRLQWTNSVTNAAAAKRILSRWAGRLREGLDEVTGHGEPTGESS